jgi:signal transduction histidine kinase
VNFAARLIAGTLAVLVVTVLVVVVGVDRSLRRDLERQTEAMLGREAELIRDALPADSLGWPSTVATMARAASLRITVVDREGRVRADSEVEAEGLARVENHATRPEIAAALQGQPGSHRRTSATVGERFMYVAIPAAPGAIRVAISLDQVDAIIDRAQRPILVAGAVALIFGIGLSLVGARLFSGPLNDIAASARSIAKGEAARFPMSGIPDIDRLTGDLRSMHEQLVDRFERLRRSQSETSAIVDSMVEGVLASDAKGRIITANPAARRLLGYGDQDPLPDLPLLFRGKDAREALARIVEGAAVADREIAVGERTYLLNARPLPAGGAVVVLHDLTHLKRLETVRRDFVANASHELKTPLTAISGYAETLLADQPEPEIQRRFLETILSNARRMQRLVDDQLDLSRIESGAWTPSPEWIAIEPAAREAWTLVVVRPEDAPTLAIETLADSGSIRADPDAVRQVFRNLFENAVRYTAPGGTITVRSTPDGSGVRLSVVDTGTGIASEHLPRIFERFYRVDPSRAREQGGTGLGLAIVKHLVESHGGRVWAESSLGRGTSIHTWWPFRASSAA